MCTKRTLFTLFALMAAWTVSAQEAVTERFAGHELLEVRHAEQRISLPLDTLTLDSLVEVRSLEVRTFIDTLRTISPREEVTLIPGDSSNRKGHYVEVHLGAGLGNVGYGFLSKDMNFPDYFPEPKPKGSEKAALSAVVQLQYAYFFHRNVGIGVGAWLSNYTSHGHLSGDFVFSGTDIIDSDGENYVHHATINRWNERQTIHTVGVPVSLQVQAWGKRNKAGFFMALGAAPTYTVKTNYHVLSGEIEHWGEYPQRGNAQIHDAHEFHSISYANTIGKNQIMQFGATALLDLGLLVRMSPHTDFLIGIYGHYSILDMQAATTKDIGWKTNEFPKIDMQPYSGILATNTLNADGSLRPWQAGIKFGVHWHSIEKPHEQIVMHSDTLLQTVERNDSVWTTRIDTLQRFIPRQKEQVQQTIDRLNRIYFAFDSYQLTEETKRSLDKIAEQLKTIPNKIILGGHASKEGSKAHNARLAHYRALVVKYYLVDCGIPSTRLIVKEYGSTMRNAINLHEDLSLDRRVEIIVQDE